MKQLRPLLPAESRFKKRQENEVARLLTNAARQGRLHAWPARSGAHTRRFGAQSYAEALLGKVLEALREEPATAPQARQRVPRRLPCHRSQVAGDVQPALEALVHDKEIVPYSPNRNTTIYFSRVWLARQAAPASPEPPAPAATEEPPSPPLAGAILAAVRELEPGRGNYVGVGDVRRSEPVKRAFDAAALALARAGHLVLASYDGPWPIPEDRRHEFVEGGGEGYIYMACPEPGE